MARAMDQYDTEVFRAVITTTRTGSRWLDGQSVITQYVGPYRTHGAARVAIAREARLTTKSWHSRDETVTVEGYVERSPITWERVA